MYSLDLSIQDLPLHSTANHSKRLVKPDVRLGLRRAEALGTPERRTWSEGEPVLRYAEH